MAMIQNPQFISQNIQKKKNTPTHPNQTKNLKKSKNMINTSQQLNNSLNSLPQFNLGQHQNFPQNYQSNVPIYNYQNQNIIFSHNPYVNSPNNLLPNNFNIGNLPVNLNISNNYANMQNNPTLHFKKNMK
jgi:hypothetical protein